MDMSPREYQDYVKNLQKKSPLLKDMALAFAIGGAICVIGQLILNGWLMLLPQDDAATATSVSLVFLSAHGKPDSARDFSFWICCSSKAPFSRFSPTVGSSTNAEQSFRTMSRSIANL